MASEALEGAAPARDGRGMPIPSVSRAPGPADRGARGFTFLTPSDSLKQLTAL